MTTKITAKQAKETRIFVIENGAIEETNLYDFVNISIDETTSPNGVAPRIHVRENEEEGTFEIWTWGILGNNPKFITSLETEEMADDWCFNDTYESDFMNDDQRNTWFSCNYEEALQELADMLEISLETMKSIEHHRECAAKIKEIKKQKKLEAIEKNKIRVEKIALEYAKMIEKVEGESYKETGARLGKAIGEKIEGAVFHAAIRKIRS